MRSINKINIQVLQYHISMKLNKYYSFKNSYNLHQRKQKFEKHLKDHPQKIPIIVQPDPNSKLPPFPNPKFCMAKDKDIIYLKMSLKQKIQKARPQQSKGRGGIFFYSGKQLLPQINESIERFYEKHKDPDGFLYITFSELQVF